MEIILKWIFKPRTFPQYLVAIGALAIVLSFVIPDSRYLRSFGVISFIWGVFFSLKIKKAFKELFFMFVVTLTALWVLGFI